MIVLVSYIVGDWTRGPAVLRQDVVSKVAVAEWKGATNMRVSGGKGPGKV